MNKEIKVNKDAYKVENGKVIIESEELANMIQERELSLNGEEEAGANNGCNICPSLL